MKCCNQKFGQFGFAEWIFLGLIFGFATLFLLSNDGSSQLTADDSKSMKNGMLRHVVLLKFKSDSSEQQIQTVVEAFCELPKQIQAIADFEFGTNVSPEGLNDGFTHCFLVTFKSEDDLKAYLPHEAHQDFVTMLRPHLDKVLVVDYWTQN